MKILFKILKMMNKINSRKVSKIIKSKKNKIKNHQKLLIFTDISGKTNGYRLIINPIDLD
jgi:hypothetical protein